jgi:hypothetical protein
MLWLQPLVEKTTAQCWGCGVFDELFRVVSIAGAALYEYMSWLAVILLSVFIAFYILHSVWENLKANVDDFTYDKYLRPVLVNSLVVLSLLLVAGIAFPRLITRVTIEPVAQITLVYSQAMLNKTTEEVNFMVQHESKPMEEEGFYRQELRDTIVLLIKTSTTQFQAMMLLGLHIMDGAFTWSAMLGIGALIKHVIMFFMGLTLAWGFFKLFIKFCFYFVDVIINLSMFAFFFPLGLVFFVFKDSQSKDWVKDLGKNIAPGMLNKVIGSIVTLATVVITYMVIMVLISRFFAGDAVDGAVLVDAVLSGDLYKGDISSDNMAAMTLAGMIVLVYVVQFLAGRIGEVSKMITDTFNIKPETPKVGEEIGKDVVKFGEDTVKYAGDKTKVLMGIGENKT